MVSAVIIVIYERSNNFGVVDQWEMAIQWLREVDCQGKMEIKFTAWRLNGKKYIETIGEQIDTISRSVYIQSNFYQYIFPRDDSARTVCFANEKLQLNIIKIILNIIIKIVWRRNFARVRMEDNSPILMNREGVGRIKYRSLLPLPFFLIFSIRERRAGVCVCAHATELGSKDLTRPSGRDPFSDLTECSIKMKPRKRHNREPNLTSRDLSPAPVPICRRSKGRTAEFRFPLSKW